MPLGSPLGVTAHAMPVVGATKVHAARVRIQCRARAQRAELKSMRSLVS